MKLCLATALFGLALAMTSCDADAGSRAATPEPRAVSRTPGLTDNAPREPALTPRAAAPGQLLPDGGAPLAPVAAPRASAAAP